MSALLNFHLPHNNNFQKYLVFLDPSIFWRYFATPKTAGRSKKSAATDSGATFRGGEELVPKQNLKKNFSIETFKSSLLLSPCTIVQTLNQIYEVLIFVDPLSLILWSKVFYMWREISHFNKYWENAISKIIIKHKIQLKLILP